MMVAKPAQPAVAPHGSTRIPAIASRSFSPRATRLPLPTNHPQALLRKRLPGAAPTPRRSRSRVPAAGATGRDVRAQSVSNSDSWPPSRRVDFGHATQRGEKARPRLPSFIQRFFAFLHELVKPPSPLPGLFDPRPLDQSALFHPVERRIERRRVKLQHALRPLFDQLGDFIAVARPVFD